ncbi:hypothetical protein RJ639_022636 [Escallonia herrerae]|uniref:Uncharacterized protein n=1 Tax=Escallonia herrerae TaxID=1293975 RepID=A0AA88V2U6_9ASTE|nr:hypothetical protein RJ639_022636 [Escallonia herrerae]
MGRELSGYHTVTSCSSIALLQERFRQLQKVKEMREGKELLRLFTDSERYTATGTSSTMQYCSKLFFHSDQLINVPPPRQLPFQVSLSLWSSSSPSPSPQVINHVDLWNNKAQPQLTKTPSSWLSDISLARSPFKYDDAGSDVDTSLHL